MTRSARSLSWVTMRMVLPSATRSSKRWKTESARRWNPGCRSARRRRRWADRWPGRGRWPRAAAGRRRRRSGSLSAWSVISTCSSRCRARWFALAIGNDVAEVHGQHHVFQHGQRRQQLEELEDDAHVLAAPDRDLPFLEPVHRGVAHQHLAVGGAVDAGDHVDQRRLAAARLADHGHKLAAVHMQIDIVERSEDAGRGLVIFDARGAVRSTGCCRTGSRSLAASPSSFLDQRGMPT